MAAVETASAFTVSTTSPTHSNSLRTREPPSSPHSWSRVTPHLNNGLAGAVGAADEFAFPLAVDSHSQSIRSLLESYAAERDAIVERTADVVADASHRMAELVGVMPPMPSSLHTHARDLHATIAAGPAVEAARPSGLSELLSNDTNRRPVDGAQDRWERAQLAATTRRATRPQGSVDAAPSGSYRKAAFQ